MTPHPYTAASTPPPQPQPAECAKLKKLSFNQLLYHILFEATPQLS